VSTFSTVVEIQPEPEFFLSGPHRKIADRIRNLFRVMTQAFINDLREKSTGNVNSCDSGSIMKIVIKSDRNSSGSKKLSALENFCHTKSTNLSQ
jgi:hypothetical protein